MPRSNGGITGVINRPNFTLAGGVWGPSDIENNIRIANWPLATSSTTVAVSNQGTPYIFAWPFTSGVGFGTRYGSPSSVSFNDQVSISFTSTGTTVFTSGGSSPNVNAHAWVTGSGFGAKYSDPSVLPGNYAYAVSVNLSNTAIALGVASVTGGIVAYSWSNASGFGTRYTPTGTSFSGHDVAWHPNGADVAIAANTTPGIFVYPWTNNVGFGTRYNNPTTIAPYSTAARGVKFSTIGNDVIVTTDSSPYLRAYPWTTGVGFGTAYSNPSVLPNGIAWEAAWNTNSTVVSIAAQQTSIGDRRTIAYPWTSGSGFGTAYSAPASVIAVTPVNGVGWTASSNDVGYAHDQSPYITLYQWSNDSGFGTKYANPVNLPPSNSTDIAFTTVPS